FPNRNEYQCRVAESLHSLDLLDNHPNRLAYFDSHVETYERPPSDDSIRPRTAHERPAADSAFAYVGPVSESASTYKYSTIIPPLACPQFHPRKRDIAPNYLKIVMNIQIKYRPWPTPT